VFLKKKSPAKENKRKKLYTGELESKEEEGLHGRIEGVGRKKRNNSEGGGGKQVFLEWREKKVLLNPGLIRNRHLFVVKLESGQ